VNCIHALLADIGESLSAGRCAVARAVCSYCLSKVQAGHDASLRS
jgi:hypothetical protein